MVCERQAGHETAPYAAKQCSAAWLVLLFLLVLVMLVLLVLLMLVMVVRLLIVIIVWGLLVLLLLVEALRAALSTWHAPS